MSPSPEPSIDLAPVERLLAERPRDRQGLIMLLQDVQHAYGYLPRPALERIAGAFAVPRAQVYQIVTFYRAFTLQPRGKHVCTVCMGTACHVRGAQGLVEHVQRKAGIKAGETTADRKLTLETVNCVGACALGPLVLVDGAYHGNVTLTRLNKLRKGIQR